MTIWQKQALLANTKIAEHVFYVIEMRGQRPWMVEIQARSFILRPGSRQ